MFPKNQATTMCVDVVSVYSPPVDTGFKNERSPSLMSAESSVLTSSASSSSSMCSIEGEDTINLENEEVNVFLNPDKPNNSDKIVVNNGDENGKFLYKFTKI